uniref:Putative secreted protein n=1 Tax=Anopheles darlingi TaxID=43151 RepID=A0A2M4DGY3_ANODA
MFSLFLQHVVIALFLNRCIPVISFSISLRIALVKKGNASSATKPLIASNNCKRSVLPPAPSLRSFNLLGSSGMFIIV